VTKAFQIETRDPTLLFSNSCISVRPVAKSQNEPCLKCSGQRTPRAIVSGKTGTQNPPLVQHAIAPSCNFKKKRFKFEKK
jgi:hypothetical protein